MAVTTPLLAGLLKKATIDDHDEILKASAAALKKSKTDIQAQHSRTIALLKLDRYDEALEFIEESGQPLKDRATLEYAYALYKTGNFDLAAETAVKTSGRGAQHLEAQAQYRLENSARVLQIYQDIKSQGLLDEELDCKINNGGAEAQSQWCGETSTRRPAADDLQQFETAYNAACGSIARGEYAQAEILLKRANELCKHHEELSEEQKEEELLPIKVQWLYVLQVQGKFNEADALANDISTDAIPDVATRAIAQSNKLLTSLKPANPFLVHKAFNTPLKPEKNDRLFSFQATPFASNQKTVDLGALKFNGLTSAGKGKDSTSIRPDMVLSSTFSAAARAENEVSKAAIRKVLPELERTPNNVGLVLTLVQMYVLTGNTTSAVELMQSLFSRLETSTNENEKNVRYNPGLVSVLIGLFRSQGRKASIQQELAKSASFWKTKSTAPASLLRAAGSTLLVTGDPEDARVAADIFSKLREQQPDDKAAIAGFVASHAADEAESVDGDAAKLTAVAALTRNIDVDVLESAGIPQSSNALAIAQLTRSRKRAADGESSKPKRTRKSRLPKDYDASKTADPERWLPMKDRSYYRAPKGRKKGKKAGGDTQGGAVNESLNIDAKPGSNAPQGGGGGGGGGKKKKGKR
ncbi:uncharacterized protein HMPREF1541_02318 [Cyphellophora europaea CBS 101466]|uniref:Signal recognition particle subunit SRP72 n=1 Tax=Cyphellophora europaea (strain CBS 101466) TaxID=1220924 RepID=W2S3H7_CYPE1|nr:uncharacterized protein HMPREF1541_02318 [Cyphellophora europaea CBS 101466]ETN43160.1 hypothetical protein HMPREF1541_02318 [Cyphellophora europaea CBS 101466]